MNQCIYLFEITSTESKSYDYTCAVYEQYSELFGELHQEFTIANDSLANISTSHRKQYFNYCYCSLTTNVSDR
jgi:hypothetical protein